MTIIATEEHMRLLAKLGNQPWRSPGRTRRRPCPACRRPRSDNPHGAADLSEAERLYMIRSISSCDRSARAKSMLRGVACSIGQFVGQMSGDDGQLILEALAAEIMRGVEIAQSMLAPQGSVQ